VPFGFGCGFGFGWGFTPLEPPPQLAPNPQHISKKTSNSFFLGWSLPPTATMPANPKTIEPSNIANLASSEFGGGTVIASVREVVLIVNVAVVLLLPGVTDVGAKLHAAPVGSPLQLKFVTA
jgi:hypothetical protein